METIEKTADLKQSEKSVYKILLVDDRPENLLTLENIIDDSNRDLLKASSGNEALKIALAEPVHLILLDVQMPDMDGFEVAQLLRMNSKTKHIPIIFVSAVSRNEKGPADTFEAGTVDFLFKPLDIKETQSKIIFFEKLHLLTKEKEEFTKKMELMNKELDHFVYAVSHDVKAPLRAIENLATWIEDDLSGIMNQNLTENLSLLKKRVGRMQNLLDGITEYSRVARSNELKEQVNVNQLIQFVLDTISPPPGFKFEIQHQLPVLFTEKTKLYKVFSHLLKNGIIHHTKTEGLITVSALKENNITTFTISDDGPGIRPQFHQKVFEIFHTLQPKDKHETAGVGLSVVKKIVESTGNKIWFEPNVIEGTTIHFTWT